MKLNNETKVGVMVSVVLVLLTILTIKTGNFNWSKSGYALRVRFHQIDGVNINSPVMVNGLEVGIVKDIVMKEEQDAAFMEVILWVHDNTRVREGATARIKNLGLMGEKYVSLSSGNPAGQLLKEGSLIVGQEPVDFGELMANGQQITASLNEHLKKNKEAIDAIIANLNTAMRHAASITENVDEQLTVHKNRIDEMITSLHAASINLDEMTYDLKINPWKLLYRPRQREKK